MEVPKNFRKRKEFNAPEFRGVQQNKVQKEEKLARWVPIIRSLIAKVDAAQTPPRRCRCR